MGDTIGSTRPTSDNGHTGSVDLQLSREHGGKPATWHARRFGHYAVNQLAARIIRTWRARGDSAELAAWLRPIEDALAASLPSSASSARLRAAIADAEEDAAEAMYLERPCPETARALLRKRAADRLASIEHDREIASEHGLSP